MPFAMARALLGWPIAFNGRGHHLDRRRHCDCQRISGSSASPLRREGPFLTVLPLEEFAQLSPGILVGLDTLGAAPVWTSLTDPLARTTRQQLDAWGQPLVVVAPDGGTTTLTRDGNGWITKETDPLNRVTTIVRGCSRTLAKSAPSSSSPERRG